jgi:hypothetical protein
MKPACRTIFYTVYPKDYHPGKDPYASRVSSLKKAKKIAVKFGNGSTIVRLITLRNKRKYWLGDYMETFIYKVAK